jgi:zinc protease
MQRMILFGLNRLRARPASRNRPISKSICSTCARRHTRSVAKRRGWLALLCAPLWGATLHAAQPDVNNVHSTALDNGLEVYVKVDRRAPVAVSMLWYRAGGMDEASGTTGVAHVLEHMMFQGTEDTAPGDFARMIAEVGGRNNAFTSSDYTGYYQQLHKSNLELALRLEADRMANLKLDEAEFQKELRVVMEERRQRVDDNPRAMVFEQLNAAMYLAHPYRHPVVGWMSDLENMQLADARAWYDNWYAPNNAVLVVAGDVDPKHVFALAEKYFGPIAARPLPVRKPQVEPEQKGTRRIVVKAPSRLPSVTMAYHVPRLEDVEGDWEPYALSILAGVLDGYSAARLEREMVSKTRVANSVSADYDGFRRGPGAFYVSVTPGQGKTVADVERVWREQLALLIEQGVTEDELRRVKAQVIASQVYSQDSVYGQASRIARMRALGLPHDGSARMTEKLRAVTAEQVTAVARKYLIDDKLTVAVLEPEAPPGQAASDRLSEANTK